jgi:hypothetical protein
MRIPSLALHVMRRRGSYESGRVVCCVLPHIHTDYIEIEILPLHCKFRSFSSHLVGQATNILVFPIIIPGIGLWSSPNADGFHLPQLPFSPSLKSTILSGSMGIKYSFRRSTVEKQLTEPDILSSRMRGET